MGRNGLRAGFFFAKWPRVRDTVAQPRQIMELAWLTLDRPCAAGIDAGPRWSLLKFEDAKNLRTQGAFYSYNPVRLLFFANYSRRSLI